MEQAGTHFGDGLAGRRSVDDLMPREQAETNQDPWRVYWHDYVPAAAVIFVMVVAWVAHRPSGGMAAWGVSAATLADGRFETIALHMLAHGGLLHLTLNSLGLLEIGGLVSARLGGFPKGWMRLLAAYGLAGLSSMIFYLSFHPNGQTPMIGASGAIYGLLGLLLGIRVIEELEPVALKKLPGAAGHFLTDNAGFLLLLLAGGALVGVSDRVAWEAHVGGLLFGLCFGPWLLPRLE